MAGIVVARRREDGRGRGCFHQFARLHDADSGGEATHQIQIMRDEQHRHVEFAVQFVQQRQDLRLHGDIKGGGRLISNQQFGAAGECHCNHRALALAARQLVRVAVHPAFRICNTRAAEQFHCARRRLTVSDSFVQLDRLRDLIADGVERIERRHGFLKNHRHFAAAHGADGGFVERQHIFAIVRGALLRVPADFSRVAGVLVELQDRQRRNAFARAGFADQREFLAGRDIE